MWAASHQNQDAGQTVVLGDKTPSSKIVFHFKSQNSVYNVVLALGATDKKGKTPKWLTWAQGLRPTSRASTASTTVCNRQRAASP